MKQVPKLKYEDWRATKKGMELVQHCIRIADEYARQGYDLSVRQLYYQLVARDLIANNTRTYKTVTWMVDKARMNGLMDWYRIVDRTRHLGGNPHWENGPDEVIESSAGAYAIDLWEGQPRRVEIWVEKQALEGVIGRVAGEMDVSYFACRGYSSTSAMWLAARRFLRYYEDGQAVTILHFGDHDPSGIDMTRDIEARLRNFIKTDWARRAPHHYSQEPWYVEAEEVFARLDAYLGQGDSLEIRRVALNMDQITQYQPPPNPAKVTDSRYQAYEDAYGDESWELDALDPSTLAQIARDHVLGIRDDDLYNERVTLQEEERGILTEVSTRWDEVKQFLRGEL
jgi:hypothetical protein